MVLRDTILIHGPIERVYELAADIEAWPVRFPHYRYVVVEERSGGRMTARMGASRDGIPVSWRSWQERLPASRRILYKHIGGITRGMDVEWQIEPEGNAVRATILHDLSYPVPILGPLFARYIVGGLFIHNIAGKTLQCIKMTVEAEMVFGARLS